MVLYVPGTEETDPKKQNMSLQQIASAASTAIDNVATNTANIATNTENIATNTANIVTNTANIVTNTANIATNTSGIAALVAGPLTSGNVAAQSDQETATSTTLAVTPGKQQFHPSAAKAWAYCTISGTTLTNASTFNMTVTRTGVGTYTVAVGANFSSANYAVMAHADKSGNIVWCIITSQSASALGITAFNAPSFLAVEPTSLSIVCYGDQ